MSRNCPFHTQSAIDAKTSAVLQVTAQLQEAQACATTLTEQLEGLQAELGAAQQQVCVFRVPFGTVGAPG